MSEILRVDSSEIAGLSVLIAEISDTTYKTAHFVAQHGTASVSGGHILDALTPALNAYRDSTFRRMVEMAVRNGQTGVELNKSAWIYHDRDRNTYDALNAHTRSLGPDTQLSSSVEKSGFTEKYGAPAKYAAVEEVKIDPPASVKDDVAQIVRDAAGWLGDVDEYIKWVTKGAWSPLEQVLEPIGGNWNEIKRIGEVYKIAGFAFEKSATNLTAGVRQVDPHWNGRAAIAFAEYAKSQAAGMAWEGPVGRTVNTALELVADEIRKAVVEIVNKLAEMIKAEVDIDGVMKSIKVLAKKIPFVGTAWQIERIIEIVAKTRDITMKLVAKIKELTEALEVFLQAVADPAKKAQDKLNEKLEPLTHKLAQTQKGMSTTDDIKRIFQEKDAAANRPKDGFDVGQGDQPWASA